jgi:hypothetical protein
VKIGTENRKSVITLAVLMAVLIPVLLYQFKGFFWGSNASAAPSVRPPAAQTRPGGALPTPDGSAPGLRIDVLIRSRRVAYEAGGRNIFTMEAARVEPLIGNVRAVNAAPMGPPPPPTPTPVPPPPPIPIKYYGYAAEPRKVFLQQQGVEQIFVAAQGDIVGRRYRVVQITRNSVTMEDVVTGNRQPIPLTPEKPR